MPAATHSEDINKEQVKQYLLDLQIRLCNAFAEFESEKDFIIDRWDRPEGGFGISRVIEGGEIFERGGANFSHVFGENMPPSATANRPELAGRSFEAMGVSVVMHPDNPFVPTSHANVRFFLAEKENETPVWWFGGGFDLTPYYGFEEDCVYWHAEAKKACEPFGKEIYTKYKKWCDDYFFIKHRNEHRGIGGLFFDDLNEWGFNQSFDFMKRVGDAYLDAYCEIIRRRKDTSFSEKNKAFQHYRRGRYVEYNLVYDRGTLFGLQSNGRAESILMSMPPQVSWEYQYKPENASEENKLTEYFLKPKDWLE